MVVDDDDDDDGVDDTVDAFVALTKLAASDTPSGIPFVKNSTATSGLPCAARKQCRTSASGNPILVKLVTTSFGNASSGLGASGTVAVVVGAGVVVDAAETAAFVGVGASAAGLESSTAVVLTAGGAVAAVVVDDAVESSLGAAGFFALVTITTKKSFSFIPHALITSSSFNIFPE